MLLPQNKAPKSHRHVSIHIELMKSLCDAGKYLKPNMMANCKVNNSTDCIRHDNDHYISWTSPRVLPNCGKPSLRPTIFLYPTDC